MSHQPHALPPAPRFHVGRTCVSIECLGRVLKGQCVRCKQPPPKDRPPSAICQWWQVVNA